jgi:PadR family transcriptional regulator PadR
VWVLESLTSGPAYGYELMARLRERLGPGVAVGPSVVYPSLARLRSSGMVRAFHGTVSRGPSRTYYELTPRGWAVLPRLRSLTGGFARETPVAAIPIRPARDRLG